MSFGPSQASLFYIHLRTVAYFSGLTKVCQGDTLLEVLRKRNSCLHIEIIYICGYNAFNYYFLDKRKPTRHIIS